MSPRWVRHLVGALVLAISGCQAENDRGVQIVSLDSLGIELPVPLGFRRDTSAEVRDGAAGGILVRLVRQQAVSGSPRVDVVAQQRRNRPTSLEEFLAENLAEMAALEKSGAIRIARLEQAGISVGPRRGYRVRHEYNFVGTDVEVTQVSTLLVLDGRGVTITAVGRTELFLPLAKELEGALSGIKTPLPGQAKDGQAPSLIEPIDLHRVVETPR
jgi:hypothetical protein